MGRVYARTAVAPSMYPRIDPARVGERVRYQAGPALKEDKLKEKDRKKRTPPTAAQKVKFTLRGVVITGATVFSPAELRPFYANYIGKRVNLIELQKIADAITVKYRNAGYIVSRAVIPAQKIRNGIVYIKVIEGFVGNVRIEGDPKGTRTLLRTYGSKLQQTWPPLRMKKLERYVLLTEDLPGIDVQTILTPSENIPGATDVTLIVDHQKFDADVALNNFGTRYLGPVQISATAMVNTLIGADQLGFRAVSTPFNNEMRFFQLFYNRPLGSSGMRLDIEGDYTRTKPGFIIGYMDMKGNAEAFRVKLSYPFIRSRHQNFNANISFKFLNSETVYLGEPLYQDHIRPLRIGAYYTLLDRWQGFNFISAQFSKGLPIWNASKRKGNKYPKSRSDGRSDYLKYDAYISRLQKFSQRVNLLLAADGQYSNFPLLSAEEFGYGGRIFGQGYDPSEIVGDSGMAGKAELRFDTFPGYKALKFIQYYALYSIGRIWNLGDNDQNQVVSAASTGVGMLIHFTDYISGRLEVDKPLTYPVQTQIDAGKNGNAWRGFFSLTAYL